MEKMQLIQNADLKNKIVLIRVDHNVVKSGKIEDNYRVDSTFGTLFNIILRGGKIILMTHVGRPKNKKTNMIEISDKTSVYPVVEYLRKKLFLRIETPDFPRDEKTGGLIFSKEAILPAIDKLKANECDIVYLPNTRWFNGEESKGDTMNEFAKKLSEIADVYVNDAFGSWQANASTVGINQYLDSYAGLLIQKEINNLKKIFEAEKPFVAVVAGSKFDTKIDSLYALLERADKLILGGVIYNAYLCAKYDIVIKGVEEEDIAIAKKFVEYAKKYPNKIVELKHIIESDCLESKNEGEYRSHNISELKKSNPLNYVLDISKESFDDEEMQNVILSAKTIFVNAVMGFTPNFSEGTVALYSLIAQNKDAMKFYGGGDTNLELKRLLPGIYLKAVDDSKYYLFTGGGAVLTAIEKGSCFAIEPIQKLIEFAK